MLTATRLLSGDVVKVWVGGEDYGYQEFYVHSKLISKKSAFFDRALKGPFREAQERTIRIQDENPLIFEFFLTWVYTSQLPSLPEVVDICVRQREDIEYTYLHLFAMADKFLAPDLQARCYAEIRQIFQPEVIPESKFISQLYDVTLPSSQLRQYFVMICAYDLVSDPEEMGGDAWHDVMESNETFAADVSKAIATRGRRDAATLSRHPYDLQEFARLDFQKKLLAAFFSEATAHGELLGITDSEASQGPLEEIRKQMLFVSHPRNLPEMVTDWPHAVPSTEAMRAAGWYHFPAAKDSDQVRCLYCGTVAENWKAQDLPFKVHRETDPDCPFVQAVEAGLQPPLLPRF